MIGFGVAGSVGSRPGLRRKIVSVHVPVADAAPSFRTVHVMSAVSLSFAVPGATMSVTTRTGAGDWLTCTGPAAEVLPASSKMNSYGPSVRTRTKTGPESEFGSCTLAVRT